jgi:hypothetical protein
VGLPASGLGHRAVNRAALQWKHRTEGNKFCGGCELVKPLGEFYRKRKGVRSSGYSHRCKGCERLRDELRRRARGVPPRPKPSPASVAQSASRARRAARLAAAAETESRPNRPAGASGAA